MLCAAHRSESKMRHSHFPSATMMIGMNKASSEVGSLRSQILHYAKEIGRQFTKFMTPKKRSDPSVEALLNIELNDLSEAGLQIRAEQLKDILKRR